MEREKKSYKSRLSSVFSLLDLEHLSTNSAFDKIAVGLALVITKKGGIKKDKELSWLEFPKIQPC